MDGRAAAKRPKDSHSCGMGCIHLDPTAPRPLAVRDRDPFLQEVAGLLQGIADPRDGDVARAIRAVQRKHFDPPGLDERHEGACFAN